MRQVLDGVVVDVPGSDSLVATSETSLGIKDRRTTRRCDERLRAAAIEFHDFVCAPMNKGRTSSR
jgi:hypothetical protein